MHDKPLRPFSACPRRVPLLRERGADLLSPYNAVCLAWLAGALQRLCPEGKTKAVDYLEAVLDEVEVEMEDGPSVVTYRTDGV